ncbi:hypothetical protein [Dyadobacter fermentans]|uniref:Uncharacterized protein n=1 Tax=Dyadobacter fermentans (strain ATCC 700827 / DSM 18053 / CIP 107007 / KCTC 52180 / NS114) TaxID=471854 RepID=C6W6A6_DYAFD|nr:hypothetical protein [Dyadobacter fermentans]ACT94246.1 hypothetical protein Dfer_3031 [Dyadobacter fermentans DSM 18053]
MEMLTLYTIASLALASVTLIGGGKWLQIREHNKLKRVLRNGRQYEALILDAQPIKPSIFNTENIRLRVQILSEKPVVMEFNYDAPYTEWRELTTGKVVTVDIDPDDQRNVMLVRKSSQPKATPAARRSALLAF